VTRIRTTTAAWWIRHLFHLVPVKAFVGEAISRRSKIFHPGTAERGEISKADADYRLGG